MTAHTPGPWTWRSSNAGDATDKYGSTLPGVIDPRTFKSTGYDGNPELFGSIPDGTPGHEWIERRVVSAGGGEYTPYSNPADALLIAAAPDLLDTLQSVRVFVQDCIVTGHDRGSLGNLYAARDAIDRAIAKATGAQP